MTNQTEIRTVRKKHPVIKAVKLTKLVSVILLAVAFLPIILFPFLYACLIITPYSGFWDLFTIQPFKDIADILRSPIGRITWLSTIATLIYTIILALLSPLLQIFFGVLSLMHVIILCIFNNKIKRLPVAILFRLITVFFGIASIGCVLLLFSGTICIYDFFRSVIIFFGGSIVLNLAVE